MKLKYLFFCLLILSNFVVAFSPPSKEERIDAIGELRDGNNLDKIYFTDSRCFEPILNPNPNDWLGTYREPGQTFDEYIRERNRKPNKESHKLYLVPLGEFEDNSPKLSDLEEVTGIFFGMEVSLLPLQEAQFDSVKTRIHPEWGVYQVYADDIIRLLSQKKAVDAYAVLAITMDDLFSSQTRNFVFGLAESRSKCGVFSFARYRPTGNSGKAQDSLILRRSIAVMLHEYAHMFGLAHCTHYSCLMNGSNHLEEADRQPLNLCPVCLRKLAQQNSLKVLNRYRNLLTFYESRELDEDAAFYRCRIAEIERETKEVEQVAAGNDR